MISLVATLQEHGEAIEADFAQHYRLDLGKLLAAGRMARVLRLVAQLPDTSRYVMQVSRDAPPSDEMPDTSLWPRTDQLLATVADQLAIANWQRGGGKKKPVLLSLHRSAESKPKRSLGLDQGQVRAYLKRVGPQS